MKKSVRLSSCFRQDGNGASEIKLANDHGFKTLISIHTAGSDGTSCNENTAANIHVGLAQRSMFNWESPFPAIEQQGIIGYLYKLQ